jgi:hypothetical protein
MLDRRVREQEEAAIRRIVEGTAWPDDVKGYDVEFGSDWEGDPAVYIWFLLDDDLRPSEQKVERVGDFRRAIRRALLDAELSHWPFVRLRATQPSRA